MSSRWKYIQCPDPEFYDLQNDPAEKTNLFAAKTRLAREFAGRLERMRQDMHEARANPVAIDERAIRTLRSLGYAASGTDAAPTTNTGTRKDPKAMLDVYDACFRAGALLETNRLQEAVELLEPLVSRNPECVQIHEYLARAYSGLKRPAEAAPHMEAALALDPHNRMMIANLGVTRLEMGDPAKAAEILRRGLCLPAGPLENALTNGVPSLTVKMRGDLAAALCQLGETDAAVAECALAIRDDPGNVDAHTTLGNIRNQQGRFAEAIRHYRAILAQVPDDALSLSNLGVALARTGQLDEAIAMHRRAVVARPDSADFHMNMGAALMMAQRTDEALVALRAAVRIDPGSTAPLMSLTSALIYVKQYAEALALWREGLKAQPGNATLAYNLAWWLATCPVSACRNGEEALALAEKLNRGASGKNPFYLDALAAAYAETGKFDKAVEAATRAVEVAAKAGSETTATAVKHRLALYAASKPYHQ
jgi:tetratricopeptide (TPR) repeat protein